MGTGLRPAWGVGFQPHQAHPVPCVSSMDRQKEHRLAVLIQYLFIPMEFCCTLLELEIDIFITRECF